MTQSYCDLVPRFLGGRGNYYIGGCMSKPAKNYKKLHQIYKEYLDTPKVYQNELMDYEYDLKYDDYEYSKANVDQYIKFQLEEAEKENDWMRKNMQHDRHRRLKAEEKAKQLERITIKQNDEINRLQGELEKANKEIRSVMKGKTNLIVEIGKLKKQLEILKKLAKLWESKEEEEPARILDFD